MSSFLSPPPAPVTARDVLQRTLSEGARKKQSLKRKKTLIVDDDAPTPQKASLVRRTTTDAETATRRLEFNGTPGKAEKKRSSSNGLSSEEEGEEHDDDDDEDEHSSGSSDEAEVSFDAMTLGNMRIIREAVPSPLSTASSASSASMPPIGLEYRFSVASTVSSIAVAPNGKFIVAGFYNGTIYLYPLTQDSLRFRHGVLLDHISARGMYTQLMVRVALPDDGKFIFAGVYRGSTEIRAFEVDSIELPSVERLAQNALARAEQENDSDDEEDHGFGVPSAKSVSHTYSDAKLKGFSAVKNVLRKSNNQTEYHLLCGLGIKNIHLWRFFRSDVSQEWSWECIFDKQSNGISIELLTFHRGFDNEIISKSEHQNIRIWKLEDDDHSKHLKKKSHVDIKQTVDTTAIYGDFAYGGGEAMALVDLRSSSRMELDLPLSAKEQEVKEANSRATSRTRITASMRGRRAGSRGRGSADEVGGQRLMRMVNQVAGQDSAPFVIGMCTDGSVFMHRPQEKAMGLATPLEYIEGYEDFFQDPSLDFQMQFSDLTRVNSSGRLAVLPLPKTEKEDWMIVAANTQQLLVRSLNAFLHRNERNQEVGKVKRGLRDALRDMGRGASSSESSSSDVSDEEEDEILTLPRRNSVEVRDSKKLKLSKPERRKDQSDVSKERKPLKPKNVYETKAKAESNVKKELKSSDVLKVSRPDVTTPTHQQPTSVERHKLEIGVDENDVLVNPGNAVFTPVRKAKSADAVQRALVVPSPVVSISSPSASSNPNTPERVKGLSEAEKMHLVAKEFEWTPKTAPQHIVESQNQSDRGAVSDRDVFGATKKNRVPKKKPSKRAKTVAQALFANDDADVSSTPPSNEEAVAPTQQKSLKRLADDQLSSAATKKQAVSAQKPMIPEASTSPPNDDDCTDVEKDLCEPDVVFSYTPLGSDGNSLVAASMYQYDLAGTKTIETVGTSSKFNSQELDMMMRFSSQVERLKKSYTLDRERIMRQLTVHECDCGSSKKKSGTKLNWRKQIAGDISKKKHMKRRHKKQVAAKLKELVSIYEAKLADIRLLQRLELQAFVARQEFQLLSAQM